MILNKTIIGIAGCLLTLIAAVSSCKKSTSDDPSADYNRGPFLDNVGNNIIVPNYQKLSVAVNSMDSAVAAFNAAPSTSTLVSAQSFFKEAYRAWQSSSVYEFGPANTVHLRASLDTYPATVSQINSNIASGTYNLEAAINLAARGFPAIDYLLFGTGADNPSILLQYTTASDAAGRKQYLADLSANIKTKTTSTLNGWLSSGGNYIHQFITSTGTDATSSTSLLLNQYVQDYDNMKNYKVYVPLGTQSIPSYPEKVEAYYCGISSELIQLEVLASQNLYLGKSGSVDGIGFDDYLIAINAKRESDGAALDPLIKAQYIAALNSLTSVPDPLSTTITNNPSVVNAAYQQLQILLPLIKREMSADMNILIAFGDDDGD